MLRKWCLFDWFKLVMLLVLMTFMIVLIAQKQNTDLSPVPVEHGEIPTPEEKIILEDTERVSEDEIPLFPDGGNGWTLDESKTGLLDSGGILRYEMSLDKKAWMPVISEEILRILPTGFTRTQDESGIWHILNAQGEALFRYDRSDCIWQEVSAQPAISETEFESAGVTCTGALASQISGVDARVVVANALIPLRASPDAETDNYLRPLPKGTMLEVIQDPVCTPFLEGANLWWRVRTEEGMEGFAAEGSAVSEVYYLREIE